MFDLFLTFEHEVRAIWSTAWNYTKVMYVLTRYSAVVEAGIIIYRTLLYHCTVFVSSPNKLTCKEISIPGDWYERCSLAFKTNACAYIIIPLWMYNRADYSLQFDNQGFSSLD